MTIIAVQHACSMKAAPYILIIVSCSFSLAMATDEVPRWEGLALNSRIEMLMEDEYGFPYITPDDSDEVSSRFDNIVAYALFGVRLMIRTCKQHLNEIVGPSSTYQFCEPR